MRGRQYTQRGFTLIEMMVVLLIGGILLSFLGAALLAYMSKNRVVTTEHRIEAIHEALSQFLSVNRRYPCPASRVQGPALPPPPGDPAFGIEVTANCNTGAFVGTVRTPSAIPVIRIGSVPTRTLNLPDEFMLDGWGRRFTYAVTERLATSLQYTADGGLIRLIDGAGNTIGNPPNRAHFVVISHGESGEGGYTLDGNLSVPCPGATTLDGANCDDNPVFRSTLVSSDDYGSNFFDDYVYFKGQTAPNLAIPAGAVVPFELATCPAGWTPYPLAEGRFVIGSSATPGSEETYIIGASAGNNPKDFSVPNPSVVPSAVTRNQHDRSFFPPYVSLLYCEKLPD